MLSKCEKDSSTMPCRRSSFLLGENMDSGFFVSFVNYFNGIINKIEKHRLFFLCYNGKRLKIQQDIVGKKGKKK